VELVVLLQQALHQGRLLRVRIQPLLILPNHPLLLRYLLMQLIYHLTALPHQSVGLRGVLADLDLHLLQDHVHILLEQLRVLPNHVPLLLHHPLHMELGDLVIEFWEEVLGDEDAILLVEDVPAVPLLMAHLLEPLDHQIHCLSEDFPSFELLLAFLVGDGEVLGDDQELGVLFEAVELLQDLLLLLLHPLQVHPQVLLAFLPDLLPELGLLLLQLLRQSLQVDYHQVQILVSDLELAQCLLLILWGHEVSEAGLEALAGGIEEPADAVSDGSVAPLHDAQLLQDPLLGLLAQQRLILAFLLLLLHLLIIVDLVPVSDFVLEELSEVCEEVVALLLEDVVLALDELPVLEEAVHLQELGQALSLLP